MSVSNSNKIDTVPFKVFFTHELVHEVRRLNIEKYKLHSLNELRQELQSRFPSYRNYTFTISWKDTDGDLITIGSDKELRTAVKEQPNEVFKLYVQAT